MPSWKKVVISGSQAELAALTASIALRVGTNQQITSTQSTTFLTGSFTGSFTGPLTGTASWASLANLSLQAQSVAVGNTPPANANQSWYIPHLTSTPYDSLSITSSLIYNPASQSLTVTASRAVSASWTGVASSSIVTGTNDAIDHFLIFTKNTGSVSLLTDTASNGIRYNPNTNVLGTVTTNGTHLGDIQVSPVATTTLYYPVFATGSSATSQLLYDAPYRYNASTKTLVVTNISSSVVTASAVSVGTGSSAILMTSTRIDNIGSGVTTIYTLPTASYNTIHFEYTATSGSTLRMGYVPMLQSGSIVRFTEYGPAGFGSPGQISIGATVIGPNIAVTASCFTAGWSVKANVRAM